MQLDVLLEGTRKENNHFGEMKRDI